MSQKTGDGASVRAHLLSVERASGRVVAELTPPDVPACLMPVLLLFFQLRAGAGSNGMTSNAITPAQIKAWADLYGVALTPWELDTLFEMDAAALAELSERKT